MGKTLILLTSAYPLRVDETFLANEIPYLVAAFDEIVIVTRTEGSQPVVPLAPSMTWASYPPSRSISGKLASLAGLVSPAVWAELRNARGYGVQLSTGVLTTALVSWFEANRLARKIRDIAEGRKHDVYVYSYWADDLAVAAAIAREKGWAHRAWSRAHGWDVYMERTGYLPFRRLLATRLDHILFVSEHGRRYFESLLGATHSSISCSRLGTPPIAQEPLARLHPFIVVSCSRLIPLKRVDLIAESLHHLTTPTRWIHIGDGPSRAAVAAACTNLPVHIEVDLRGALPPAGVAQVYTEDRPSLFLSVSESEGLPVAMMEAMSAGIPVVGTDVGGVPEIVADRRNGALLPADPTPAEVASVVDRFAMLSPSEYARYSRAAWETWISQFRADRNYQKFLEAIQA